MKTLAKLPSMRGAGGVFLLFYESVLACFLLIGNGSRTFFKLYSVRMNEHTPSPSHRGELRTFTNNSLKNKNLMGFLKQNGV